MTITLPLPPRELHPNARVHFMARAKQTKSYRFHAAVVVRQTRVGVAERWKTATVQATFYFKDKRRRDKDGMLSSLKASFDGLADAGLIADDSGLTHLPVIVKLDKKNPRVELIVTEAR